MGNKDEKNKDKIIEHISNLLKEVNTNANLPNSTMLNLIKETSKDPKVGLSNDRVDTRKSSNLNLKGDSNMQIKFCSVDSSPKKTIEPLSPLDKNLNNKALFSTKNRLLSSKARKSVSKSEFRPNTASMNRNIISEVKREENANLKAVRPMTAAVKGKSNEKNIINININFYKIDLNQKYFDPASTKSLLYINKNIFKTEELDDKIRFSNADLKANICKTTRISSARIPELKSRYNGNNIV